MKRVTKSVTALLLALVLSLTLLPAQALAADTAPAQTTYIGSYVNPAYAGKIGIPRRQSTLSVQTAQITQPKKAGTVYTSEAAAAADLRKQMVSRSEVMSVTLRSASKDVETIALNLWNLAIDHVEGSGTTGDYLRWQFAAMSGSVAGESLDSGYRYTFTYVPDTTYSDTIWLTTNAQEAALTNYIRNTILPQLSLGGKTTYQKVQAIYNWITANVKYDYSHMNDPTYWPQYTAYAAAVQKKAVCQGYANLFYRLANDAGVDCRIITGKAYNDDGTADHAWNIVRMEDEKYYCLDATWDAGSDPKDYDYFLKGLTSFSRDHQAETDKLNTPYWTQYQSRTSATDYKASSTQLPAPTVTGGNDSQGRPTLKWNAVTGAAKYEVYRSYSENGTYTKYSTTTGTSYTNISYIENGNTYYYKVRALDADGTAGAWSSIVSVTYRAASTGTLSAPTVTGGNDAQGRPTLKWNAVTGAAKYEVYRARSKDGDYIKYSTVTGTSYTNTSYIEDGNTYYYKVRALDASGTAGAWSSIVSVTYRAASTGTLSAPTVTGGNDSQGRPTLKWNAVTGAAKYEVYRARSMNGDYIKYSTVTGTSYTNISYIENGNTYYYKVRALKSDGTAGAWSSIVSVTYRKPAAATVASGKCGDSASWKLDAEGTLTISGTGATYDFFDDYNCTAPWYDAELRLRIKKVVVEKGITYVGTWAFYDCSEMTSVSLPTTLETMGASVFMDCTSLTSVTIPAGVTFISGDFFRGCTSLKSVTLPDSLRETGGCTFMYCTSLTSVRLPATLLSISWQMFKDCKSLTSLTIPRSVVDVKQDAFSGCTALKNVTYTGTTADWKALTIYSGNEALTRANVRCTGSTVLTAPTLTLSVSKKGQPTLKWNAVSGAAGYQIWCSYDSGDGTGPWYHWLTNLDKRTASFTDDRELEKGRTYTYKVRAVTSSGAVGSFSKEVTFTYNPAASLAAPTVTAGLDDQGYPALTWPAVPDAARYEVYRAASEDGNFAQLAAVTSNSYTNSAVLTDGAAYYYKVRALDSDGEAGPFSDVVSVTYTARPALVASGKCGDSASWKLDADGVLTITGAGPMADYSQPTSDNCAPWRTYANDIKKVVVQKGVTAIGSYAFASLERVTSVTIPEGVTSIGSSAFENCGLMAYGGLGAVTLPEGLTTIGSSAFSGSYMDSLTLPESLRTIGGAAFEKSHLKTLTIPGGVTSIGNGAFSNSHLTSIQLPDGAQLGAMLFYQCYELTDVTLPADLTVIGDSMFENCTKLTHVTIPSGVTRIEREAFTMCGALEEIRLPEGVETIGVIAFSGCVAMTGAYLPRSLTTIESGAFSACRSLTDVYYGGTAAEWLAISVADRNDPLLNAALHCTGQSASRLDVPAMTLGEDCSDGKPTVWWPAVTGAERYEIWRAQAASDGSAPAASAYTLIVSADVTFHKDTTAEADTWYYYKVRAVSGSAYSDFSQAARRYCEAPPTMDTPEITSLELDDSGKPVLTWRTVEGAARYQVFRSEDNGFSYSPMGTVLPTGSDTITWTDTTAVSGIGYYYGVGCYDDNGHYSSFGSGEWWVTAR